MPNLTSVDFDEIKERLPEKWEESVGYPVEHISGDTYRVNDADDGDQHMIKLVKRGDTWHTWCECRGFDMLDLCVHVFSVARTSEKIDEGAADESGEPEEPNTGDIKSRIEDARNNLGKREVVESKRKEEGEKEDEGSGVGTTERFSGDEN